jgi:succinate dehydrogenase / fumarate reductase flavoprotein subunit
VPREPGDERPPNDIPHDERYYFLEERYPRFGNLVPRDVASRAAKIVCDDGHGVGPTSRAVYMDFHDAIEDKGAEAIESRYGNLFDLYERLTGETPWETPMRIYPAPHYSMGGLWVDYRLETTIPGLFAIGEANFSDHGANRLGASAMMQCLADGYFVVPHTVTDYLVDIDDHPDASHPAFDEAEAAVRERVDRLVNVGGTTPATEFHHELGNLMLDKCGITRDRPGLELALSEISGIRREFWDDLRITEGPDGINHALEYAGRVADFLELAELMCHDALERDESCGCHLREEHQSAEGEPIRNDRRFSNVSVWEHRGEDGEAALHIEELDFDQIEPVQRSYK